MVCDLWKKCVIRNKLSPLAAMFLIDQIYFSYFCIGPPSDFSAKSLKTISEKKMLNIQSYSIIRETDYAPWLPCFWWIKLI